VCVVATFLLAGEHLLCCPATSQGRIGATVSLDSLTLYGTNWNTTYSEARGGYVYDSQIVGTYALRS
jgi:hypothetical protein